MTPMTRCAILGSVGLPPRYGGFETLAAELVRAAGWQGKADRLHVWCSAAQAGAQRPAKWMGAHLHYLPWRANGGQSVLYDAQSLFQAARMGLDCALLLGVPGAFALPMVKARAPMRIVVHLDGLEWQRAKWGPLARGLLRKAEALAVRHADDLVADNPVIAERIETEYGRACHEITYGHEHALTAPAADIAALNLPRNYALTVARVEPENNLHLILEAFAPLRNLPLVAVGNWAASGYGRRLRARYQGVSNLHLIDPVYDPGQLRTVRDRAVVYLHGHSAGGTNPSLVEMMGLGIPVAAYDCPFNRATTGESAAFFRTVEELRTIAPTLATTARGRGMGQRLKTIAQTRYRWRDVTATYFQLLGL